MSPEWIKHPNAKALVRAANDSDPYGVNEATPLPAGRELDALVAEKVFGYRIYFDGISKNADLVSHYSTDIAAAWLVVEHLQKSRNLSFALGLNACANGHQNGAKFFRGILGVGHDIFDNAQHEGWHVVDETVPLAICRAALAAEASRRASGSSDRE